MRITAVMLVVILSSAGAAAGQVLPQSRTARTVTNAELEKFRQTRLRAEREYRENYAQLGFPSPEDLERQIEQSRVERENLSAKLREERLERARIQVDRMRAEADLVMAYNQKQAENAGAGYEPFYGFGSYGGYGPFYGGYPYGGFPFGNGRFRRYGFFGYSGFGRFYPRTPRLTGGRFLPIPGYRVTPAGVFDAPVRTGTPGPRAFPFK